MEIGADEYANVGGLVRSIDDALKGGIAIIALQKDSYKEYGHGGMKGMERPRLYLTMDYNILRIKKAKNKKPNVGNINGMWHEFELKNGQFVPNEKGWRPKDTDPKFGDTYHRRQY